MKVIWGDEREATGTLLSIDNKEGVVRMDDGMDGENIKLLPLKYLCKLKED